MNNKLLSITLATILLAMSGCATRTLGVQECPKEAPRTVELKVPGPDPLLFQECLMQLLAQISAQDLPKSCSALRDWRLSTLNGSADK